MVEITTIDPKSKVKIVAVATTGSREAIIIVNQVCVSVCGCACMCVCARACVCVSVCVRARPASSAVSFACVSGALGPPPPPNHVCVHDPPLPPSQSAADLDMTGASLTVDGSVFQFDDGFNLARGTRIEVVAGREARKVKELEMAEHDKFDSRRIKSLYWTQSSIFKDTREWGEGVRGRGRGGRTLTGTTPETPAHTATLLDPNDEEVCKFVASG